MKTKELNCGDIIKQKIIQTQTNVQMKNILNKTEEKFNGKFCDIKFHHKGVACFNDVIVKYNIKQFIRQEQIKAIRGVLKKMPLERTEKWQDMIYTFTGDIDDIKIWRDKILKELK